MSNKIYISTTLPYANSKPHVGHALEFIQADFLARYYRSKGKEVFFNIGLDEHGVKIFEKASQLAISPKEHISNQYHYWKEFCKSFNISYDNFYRTSDSKHKEIVEKVWNNLLEKGLIEKRQYTGKYCKGCEEFKNEKDLVLGKCELHINTQLEDVNEENYFLKDSTKVYNETDIDFLKPESKSIELRNFYEEEQDLSISRLSEKSPWGITVPNDDEQTVYVWFEALLNYINSCGEEYWNESESIILCGPDNLRFQGKLLRQIYESSGFEYLNKLYVHGSVLDESGKKMSKSVGNVINPLEELESNNELAVRYYILNGIHTTKNSPWKQKEVAKLYNAHIVNDYGNLISRTLHLIDKFNIDIDESKVESNVEKIVTKHKDEFNEYVENFEINRGLNKLSRIVKFGNEYINDREPWKKEDPSYILNSLYYLLDKVTECYKPVIPNHYDKVKDALKSKKKQIIFEKL